MAKSSIAFIAGTLGQGGAERQLYYYLKSLKSNSYEPYVLSLNQGEFWEDRIRELGVPILWVGKSKNQLSRLFSIIIQISKRPTDIIHSQHFFTNLYAYFAGLFLRKKVIGSLRSNVFNEIEGLGLLGKTSLLLPKLVVANSRTAIENAVLLGKPRNQLFYLPNVVDEIYFSPNKGREIAGKIQVVFIGTLRPLKRVDRIIRIARRCLDLNLEIEFKLYGDGEQEQELQHLAKTYKVFDVNLFFMGSIVNTRKVYQESDILLLTSDYEGSPNVVLEAMSSGLPVISTNVGDLDQLITNGVNGFIFEDQGFEDEVVKSLVKLNGNRMMIRDMGSINRKLIEKEVSLDNTIHFLSNLYSS